MSDPPAARTLASRCRAPDVPLAPGQRIDQWTIVGTLGAGGMATVYEVRGDDNARAAIKLAHTALLTPELTAETFVREARIAAAVGHPGAIAIRGSGTYHGRPYLVLELLGGTSLGARLDNGMPLPRPIACELLLELVDVLRASHAAGITHRDLKPDNIFMLAPGAGRRLKVLDWGVAHVAGEPDPFDSMIAGTLTYVAPEQIRGEALDAAADIYSLGVLAFRLLCTRAPFAAPSDLQLIRLHLHAPPPRAQTAWPNVPAVLDELLAAMLAKNPRQRPVLDEIERVLRVVLAELEPRRFARGTEPHVQLRPPPRWSSLALGLARVAVVLGAIA